MRNSGAITGRQARPSLYPSWSSFSRWISVHSTLRRRFSIFQGTISSRSATCLGKSGTTSCCGCSSPQATSHPSCLPRARDLLLLHELQLEQIGPQPAAVEHLPVERFLEPVLREVALADEDLADAHARPLF